MHKVINLNVVLLSSLVVLSGCNSDSDKTDPTPIEPSGRWLKGDLHVHTAVSQDARETQSDILKWAFGDFGLDYVSLSNHMRNNSQDNDDNDVGGLLFYDALTQYEIPGLKKNMPNYEGKIAYSSFEWDMPTHEHFNIGILGDEAKVLSAVKTFEYRFSSKNDITNFDPKDVAAWTAAGIPVKIRLMRMLLLL